MKDVYYNEGEFPIFISRKISRSEQGFMGGMENKIIVLPGQAIDVRTIDLAKRGELPEFTVAGNPSDSECAGER